MSTSEWKVVVRLVLAHALQHPARVILTLVSTIAAAGVVVWVVSGYDSLAQKFDEFAESYMGRYEVMVLPATDESQAGGFGPAFGGPTLAQETIDELRADNAVAAVDPVYQARARITNPNKPESEEAQEGMRRGGRRGNRATPSSGTSDDSSNSSQVVAGASAEGARAAAKAGDDTPAVDQLQTSAVAPAERPARGGQNAAAPNPAGMRAGMGRFNRAPTLVGTDATEPPHEVLAGRWIDPRHPDRLEAAISRNAAEFLEVKVGDEVAVAGGFGSDAQTVKIVGIVQQTRTLPPPKFTVGLPPSRAQALRRGPTTNALYVPLELAAKLTGQPARYSYAGVMLREGEKPEQFNTRWMSRYSAGAAPVEMHTLSEVAEEIDNSTTTEVVRMQAYSATGISLLAALFIIFTTLSMGVHERIRQFAVLRAVSLTKAQIGAMIAIESVFLGLVGWAGGLAAGWGILTAVRWYNPGVLNEGASLGMWCIVLSGACALGGSLAAAIMPAWQATRVSPLDAMAPRQMRYAARLSWGATIVGLLLIAVNPVVVFYIPMADTARYGISAALGCTSMAIGFVLLAPLAVILTERFAAPLVSRLFALNPRLLSTQLTSNLWRTVGTTVALTLGLGLFVAMQTWGYSMLGPFTPGNWSPDLVAAMRPAGIPFTEISAVQNIPGVKAGECLPLAVEQTRFADDVTGFKTRASAARQDNCVMIGVDPDKGLGGDHPMFKFKFVEGTRQEAVEKIKRGRYCLVPDHFSRESDLHVGDKFGVVPPESPEERVDYEIAGVVSMDGWHWISKVGLRNRNGGRAAGLMFGAFDQVRDDFQIKRVSFFWMNLDGKTTEEYVQQMLTRLGDEHYDPQFAAARRGGQGAFAMMGRPGGGRGAGSGPTSVEIRTREGVREAIRKRADGIIWGLSALPLVTLAVSALGVVNTVLSSIRARRWDFGVLRALGLSRFALFRLVLAEALLVGLVACLLSFGFGVMAGYCGTGITRYINIRGGLVTPLIVPWFQIAMGFLITLGLCAIAALLPAAATGRTEPLRLLQIGRATM